MNRFERAEIETYTVDELDVFRAAAVQRLLRLNSYVQDLSRSGLTAIAQGTGELHEMQVSTANEMAQEAVKDIVSIDIEREVRI